MRRVSSSKDLFITNYDKTLYNYLCLTLAPRNRIDVSSQLSICIHRCQILGGSSEAIITVNFEENFFRAAFRAPGVFLCGSSRFILIKGDQEVSKTCLIMV